MKTILFVFLGFSTLVSSATSKESKSEKRFKKKVHSEVLKRIAEIKKKPVVELTRELIAKRQELENQEAEISHRMEQIKISEKNLQIKISDFEQKQKKIIGCMEKNEQLEKQRIESIGDHYFQYET